MADKTDTMGPSWYDVELLAERIATKTSRLVTFDAVPFKVGEYGKRCWQVNAYIREARALTSPVALVGGAQFKGNSGAKTMAAAMYLALLRLDERLDEQRDAAERQAAF